MTMTPADCEEALRNGLPGFSFGAVEAAEHGWSFCAFVVDGEWLFRFPRSDADARLLEREFELLPALSARLPVSVPRYEHRGEWQGRPFGGYRRIEGDPMHEPGSPGSSELPRELGEMLTALHGFPVEMAAKRLSETDPAMSWLKRHREFQAECAERAFPVLSPRDRIVASELFNRFNSSLGREAPGQALVHCDLGIEHILCNDGHLAGVIDWSDAALGDPAIDFAGILAGAGPTWLHLVVEYYDRPTGEHFMERIRYFHQVAPLHDVLYGLAAGDKAIVRAGVRGFASRTR